MMLVPPGSRQGLFALTLASNVQSVVTADRDYLVRELRFWFATALTTQTVQIEAEGQTLFSGTGVQVAALQSAWSANPQAPANNGLVIWRPDTPLAWTQSFPLKFQSASALYIVGMADLVLPPVK